MELWYWRTTSARCYAVTVPCCAVAHCNPQCCVRLFSVPHSNVPHNNRTVRLHGTSNILHRGTSQNRTVQPYCCVRLFSPGYSRWAGSTTTLGESTTIERVRASEKISKKRKKKKKRSTRPEPIILCNAAPAPNTTPSPPPPNNQRQHQHQSHRPTAKATAAATSAATDQPVTGKKPAPTFEPLSPNLPAQLSTHPQDSPIQNMHPFHTYYTIHVLVHTPRPRYPPPLPSLAFAEFSTSFLV